MSRIAEEDARPTAEGHTIVEIDSELYRTYTYKDGSKFRINDPKTLYITENGSHRIVDGEGVTHRPERDYLGISWKPRAGSPPFVV